MKNNFITKYDRILKLWETWSTKYPVYYKAKDKEESIEQCKVLYYEHVESLIIIKAKELLWKGVSKCPPLMDSTPRYNMMHKANKILLELEELYEDLEDV